MKKTKLLNILEVVFAVCVCIALVLSLTLAGDFLMPARNGYGAMWDRFLNEDENTIDIMFFGTSLAYCDIIPPQIYEATGLTSYVMAGPAQTVEQTYYYIREALKTQSPQLIYVEVSGAFSDYDLYPKVNVGYMPWTFNRLAATFTCAKEEWKGLLFPLYNYHSRLLVPDAEGYRGIPGPGADDFCGYTRLFEVKPISEEILREEWLGADENENFTRSIEYLQKISDYCAEKNVELVFYLTPTTAHAEEVAVEKLLSALGEMTCRAIADFSWMAPDIGINYETDWYDARHLNFSGATKFTEFLSISILQMGLESAGTADAQLWESRVEKLKIQ